ncbi:hypothetical protein NMY22_g6667 [Coprinellus aureogranulatus]|nr:hypothetical protein NMY22_g6667 [Coprinellus aureogranulatus]
MKFSSVFVTLLPLLAAEAQDILSVAVGRSGLAFEPTNIIALEGETVVFTFYPTNHASSAQTTVTQSSFERPCTTISGENIQAADSGFIPVSSADAPQTWNYTVRNRDPTYFYCAQTTPVNHCQSGMVFAINAVAENETTLFEAFQERARNSASIPPDTAGDGNGAVLTSVSGVLGCFFAALSTMAVFAFVVPALRLRIESGGNDGSRGVTQLNGKVFAWCTYTPLSFQPLCKPVVTMKLSLSHFALLPLIVSANDHVILVDKDGRGAFDPPVVRALQGDTMIFHLVVQSLSYDQPCKKYDFFKAQGMKNPFEKRATGLPPGAVGMFSWTLQVSEPLFMFSSQLCPKNFCKEGMVLAINPLANQTFEQLQENARMSPDPQPDPTDCSWLSSNSGNSSLDTSILGAVNAARADFGVAPGSNGEISCTCTCK